MEQLTKEQAIALAEGKEWEDWTSEEIVKLQLFQDRLCMPFGIFHEAIEEVLDRSIWTHEFAFADRLRDEYLTLKPSPTAEEILSLIPEGKLIVLDPSGSAPDQVSDSFDVCDI